MMNTIRSRLKTHLWSGLRATLPFLVKRELTPLQRQLVGALDHRPDVFFVQVGSNDGLQGDPLHDLIKANKLWCGVFIEPLKPIFERLIRNYDNANRFTFENVAIGIDRGFRDFFFVSDAARREVAGRLPDWYDQLGSFSREHIGKHLEGRLMPFMVSERVECVSLKEVLERNGVQRIDLMHIDTEGFDYKVLSQLDFQSYKPRAILYEVEHLSDDEKGMAAELLISHGYGLTLHGPDILAILRVG